MRRWSPPHEASPGRERRPGTSGSVRNRAPPRAGRDSGMVEGARRLRRDDVEDVPMNPTAGPRVLLDATAVPENRGGVGRYVDQLLVALQTLGADVAVACQSRDREHYGKLLPSADVFPAPETITRPAARLLWEQVGLPRLAARAGAQVLHCPHYTMPLRPGL